MATLIKSLVGSRAHGLNREDSDWDWRGIFITPTRELLSFGYEYKAISWIEGKEDHTNYELGHFLNLACRGNPSVLELLRSPTMDLYVDDSGRQWGRELQDLMPYMYNPKDAFNAFTGYSNNQRKKFLDDKEGRKNKFALAYIRTLINLNSLLETGEFTLAVADSIKPLLVAIRNGDLKDGAIIDLATELTENAKTLLPNTKDNQDKSLINQYPLEAREEFWDGP